MSDAEDQSHADDVDDLIREVRRARREVCQQAGHDIDKLVEQLDQTIRDYDARAGAFASLSEEAAARLVASWGDLSGPVSDPLIDNIREIRQRTSRSA
jgi:chemotaxis regulatin CheY-phosphate phosphatase CheZ